MLTGLSAVMPQVFIDPDGLSLSGGLLSFAWTRDAPLLFDSANGKVALYFQGSDNQFFVTYYDTLTERASYLLQTDDGNTEVVCVSRSSELEGDKLQIEVSSDPDDQALCTLTIMGSGIVETWRKVSRRPQDLAKTLNGEYANREFIATGTIEQEGGQIVALNLTGDARRGVSAGKTLIVGNIRLVVQEDARADKRRILVTGDRLSVPPEVLPVYYLSTIMLLTLRQLTCQLTCTMAHCWCGRWPVLPLMRSNIDQKVTSGATLTCKWTAAAPGSTLTFDGQNTVARFNRRGFPEQDSRPGRPDHGDLGAPDLHQWTGSGDPSAPHREALGWIHR